MELYAIRNKEGKYLRAKGYNGYGECWVDDLEHAKIYTKQKVALTQITFWAKNYPKFGAPDLIVLEANVKEVVDQEERTKKSILKIAKNKIKEEITKKERRKNYLNTEIKKLEKEALDLSEEATLKRGYF